MKRSVLLAMIVLVLGALSTIVIAWRPLIHAGWPAFRFTTTQATSTWPMAVPEHWPPLDELRTARFVDWTLTRFVAQRFRSARPSAKAMGDVFFCDQHDFGWPFRALRAERQSEFIFTHRYERAMLGPPSVWREGVPVRQGLVLPLRPIWPGFAINTVFYALILWGLFALGGTPFALRKRRRIKRGLCPKCAYPVGTWGGAVCTECGAGLDDGLRVHA